MKVPKMYKSSDRYNAGTDVIYDDDSKLQYAPFIYAGITAKDNGDDDGGDEEGEDSMVITYDVENEHYDKTWQEVVNAFNSGKTVVLKDPEDVDDPDTPITVWYIVEILPNDEDAPADYKYGLTFATVFGTLEGEPETSVKLVACATPSDYLVNIQMG